MKLRYIIIPIAIIIYLYFTYLASKEFFNNTNIMDIRSSTIFVLWFCFNLSLIITALITLIVNNW